MTQREAHQLARWIMRFYATTMPMPKIKAEDEEYIYNGWRVELQDGSMWDVEFTWEIPLLFMYLSARYKKAWESNDTRRSGTNAAILTNDLW